MGYQLGIPQALAKFGCTVEVVSGWQTRGSSSFNPGGVVGHHTAGPATGIRPCLNLVTYGHSTLSGPLCNVYQDRNGVAIVVAAGRANHAGEGGFRGNVGNSSMYGIEAESKGTEPGAWTAAQLASYPRIVAGLLWLAQRDESWYCRHATWAPTRKIDTVTLSDTWMRDRVAPLLRPAPAPTPTPVQEDDMPAVLTRGSNNQQYLTDLLTTKRHVQSGTAFTAMKADGIRELVGPEYDSVLAGLTDGPPIT